MANGDAMEIVKVKGLTQQGQGFKLLDATAVITDGKWVDVRTLRPGSVEISGAFTGLTLKLCGSNAATPPADNTHGTQIGSDITAAGFVSIGMPIRWIKARVTAITTNNVSANFHSTT